MSFPIDQTSRGPRRKQDILRDALSFGDALAPQDEELDFGKSMVSGLGQASMASMRPPEVGADQTGNNIQKAGAIAAPMLLAGKGAAAGAGAGAAAGTAGSAGTLAALSNPVTAAAIIGGTMLAGGLAQNSANESARKRQVNVDRYKREADIALDTAKSKQNAFNQLMQGYSAALR